MLAVLAVTLLVSCSANHRVVALATPSAAPVATGDYPIYGRAPDNTWLAGKIERKLSCVYLRFADERNAPWNGRIALDATSDQNTMLHDGDAVIVHGDISALSYGTCGSPSYRVNAIEEH